MQPAEFDYGDQMEADFGAQEAMFEQPIDEMEPMADLGPQTIENIVEAELPGPGPDGLKFVYKSISSQRTVVLHNVAAENSCVLGEISVESIKSCSFK